MSSQTKTPREGDFWPDDQRNASKTKYFLAGGIVLAVAVAAALFFVLSGGDDKAETSAEGLVPTSFVPQAADKDTAKLNSRAADPRPLTLDEVFGDAKAVKYRDYRFNLADSKISDCRSATWGELVQRNLAAHGCTQLLRGAFMSEDKRNVGQFFVLNMADAKGSQQALTDLDPELKGGFVLPLTGPGFKNFGKGFSAAYAQAIGHYVMISWMQRTDGASVSLNELIDTSLAVQQEDFAWSRLVLIDPRDK
ncbi:MAG: hypothetical protein ABIS86_02370 [Streptosporangiaceae bacterium]